MKTEKQKFKKYLRDKGFSTHEVLSTQDLVSHYRITDNGDHTLIRNRSCCMFDGVDTKDGDLGCVTFYYRGSLKKKYKKTINQNAEILKKVILPKNTLEAIKEFETWRSETSNILKTWKTVI